MKEFLLLSLLQGISASDQGVTSPSLLNVPIETSTTQDSKKNMITATITYSCEDTLVKKNMEIISFTFLTILAKEHLISTFTADNTNPEKNSFSFTTDNTTTLNEIYVLFIRFLPKNNSISLIVKDPSNPLLEAAPQNYMLASMNTTNVFLHPLFIQMLDAENISWSSFPADEYTPTSLRSLIVVSRVDFNTFLKNSNYKTLSFSLSQNYAALNNSEDNNQPLIPSPPRGSTPKTNPNQEETITTTTLGFKYTIPHDKLAHNFYLFLEDYIKPIMILEDSSINFISITHSVDKTVTVLIDLKNVSSAGDLVLYLQNISPQETGNSAYLKRGAQLTYIVLPQNPSKTVIIPGIFNKETTFSKKKEFKSRKDFSKWLKTFLKSSPEYRDTLEQKTRTAKKRNTVEENFKKIKQL